MTDWDDLRYFLSVARTGSTLAAGKALRVSQTTAARRVAALERALGLTLFERRQAGYALTPAGEALLERAVAVEAAMDAFADAAGSQAREASGTVRLTTEELYAVTVLAPVLRAMHEQHPTIRVELDTSEELRDLGAGAADVALRSVRRPAGGGLVGRRIADDPWSLYCSRAYAEARGVPRNRRELRGHPLIGGGGPGVWKVYRAWLVRTGLEDAVAMHHDTTIGLLSAVRSGIGLGVLPGFVAGSDPDLIRCLPPAPDDDRGLWLLTHERLRHTPRVRTVLDFLAEHLPRMTRRPEEAAAAPADPIPRAT
jgi:DNA-binding transcriptional LysR family regulator